MRALDLRAEAGGDRRVEGFLRHFFGLLARGAWDEAAWLVTDPVQIFDRTVARAAFAGNQDRSIAADVEAVQQLPPTIPFSAEEQRALFAGPLEGALRACFVTVTVAGERVSYGVVVDLADYSDPRLARLFDPGPFKEFAAALREERARAKQG